MEPANVLLRSILRRTFKPKENISPAVWVEKNIRLSPKTSNISGRYSLLHTPYLRRIYEDFGDPRIRKVVLKKSAQIGATQLASNLLLYYVCNEVFPLLMILPSKQLAQQFSERSLHPSIESCESVRPFLTDSADDLKKTEFLFRSCIARVIGAGSPSQLSSNPAAIVIIDECDKGEDFANQGEAPALELAEDRTISFPNDKKILILSTPTSETTSIVQSQYLLGSQSKYFVPCPYCQHEQTLIFDQIKWDKDACKLEDETYDIDKVESATYYECISCNAHLSEQDKIGMVRSGIWKDTNPKSFPSEIRSYHISALYSFNVKWGGLAKMFLLSKDDVGKLRNFYNSFLGECFEQRAATIKRDDIDGIISASPAYAKGELLSKPEVLILGADTQGSSLWYAVQAVYADGTSSLVDWGEAATFDDLKLIFKNTYPVKGTANSYGIHKALIDMGGDRTEEVKAFCVSTGFNFLPIVGRNQSQGLLAPLRETTFPHKQYRIPGLIINDKTFKDILYLGIIKERSGKLFLPQNCDDEIKIQLSGEQLVEKKNARGKLETFWKSARRNHLGDCCKYLEAFKYLLEPRIKAKQMAEAQAEQKKREYVLRPPILQESYAGNEWG